VTDKICMLVTNRAYDDPRVCTEAEALSRAGMDVTVIGWDRDAEADYARSQRAVRFECLQVRSTHGRGLSQILFLRRFWNRARRRAEQLAPRVIHCHDLDTLPAGRRVAGRIGAKLVFDAHENYPDMMVGHLPRPAVWLLRRLERRLLRSCDLLITVGDRLADHYRLLGARQVTVVGNWKDPGDFAFDADAIAAARRELGIRPGQIAVCFVANLGPNRHLEPLLEAIAGDERFACVIGGDGPQAELVRRYARRFSNVRYLGRVQPDRVPLITAACDVVYYGFDQANPNARWSAPNKLYEAIAAAKPMLAGDFGEVGPTVRRFGCGVLTRTDSAGRVRDALERFTDEAAMRAMIDGAVRARRRFCRDAAVRRLLDAYGAVLGREGSTA